MDKPRILAINEDWKGSMFFCAHTTDEGVHCLTVVCGGYAIYTGIECGCAECLGITKDQIDAAEAV